MTTSAPTMSDLEKHLQAACNLELWTIPLYLTAAYSITNSPTINDPQADLDTDPQTIILSVAVQEMYHLQLASNMAGAYGIIPELAAPSYNSLPYIHPESQPVATVELGNAVDVIGLMVEVETPDPGTPPTSPQYDAEGNPSYDSIGDLYNVLRLLAAQFPLAGSSVQNVSSTFGIRYPANKVDSYESTSDANTVVTSIHVIGDQGEGQMGEPTALLDLDPDTEPASGSRFYGEDHISHWYRFKLIQDYIQQNPGGLQVYATGPYNPDDPAQKTAQDQLNVVFTQLLIDLRSAWQTGSLSLDAMWLINPAVTAVLQLGVTPQFADLGTLGAGVFAQVAAQLDPYYSVRPLRDPNKQYPENDVEGNPGMLHACQGLNTCAGKGAPDPMDPHLVATGTQAGDGNCATAVPHTCSNSNDCNYQGGCGFSPYLPGANTGGQGSGGCQIPISPQQVLAIKDTPPAWDTARTLLQTRLKKSLPKVTDNERRLKVSPSHPMKSKS